MLRPENRLPDFSNLAAVLEKKVPSRPTLFEFFTNGRIANKLYNKPGATWQELCIKSYEASGYDYSIISASGFHYTNHENQPDNMNTTSLNKGHFIYDRASFDKFNWNNPDDYSMDEYIAAKDILPKGMKIIPSGPGGILENVIDIVGYDNLCIMIYEDEQLVFDVFEKVATTLIRYYELAADFDFVGAIMSNDDWGFKTQTMLSPDDMRKFVFPWHKKIVELAHGKGLYVMLHSCGYYKEIIDDVIYDLKYDGRHSYEDGITPVEEAYEELQGKIAVLGGIDVDFMVNESPENIFKRARALIEQTATRGGFALGTGNSVPEYIPDDHYLAMVKAVFSEKYYD